MSILLRKNIGWLSIIVLSLLPIIRWLFISPLNLRFFDLNSSLNSFGQIAGLSGIVLFSLNLFLSARSHFLDRLFFGLDKLYINHRRIGAIGFSLLLFHPLFLVVKYIQLSLREAALFLLPGNNFAITYGIIALGLLIALIAITFYAKIKYQHWKISHKFMVLAFVFAILHSFFISSDISRDPVLRIYILGLALLGLAAGFYQAFLSRRFNRDFTYEIAEVNTLSPQVVSLILKPKSEAMVFAPGQFVFVGFKNAQVGPEKHPFSIASAPAEKNLKLVIKALGDFTAGLKNLKGGDLVRLEGPYGRFSHVFLPEKEQVWIAGGVGITPFTAMAKSLRGSDYRIELFYCVKDRSEAVLLSELQNASPENLKIIPWYSGERGRITGEAVKTACPGLAEKSIMLCGPTAFMDGLKVQLVALGVPHRHIHWEKFNFI